MMSEKTACSVPLDVDTESVVVPVLGIRLSMSSIIIMTGPNEKLGRTL